MAEQLKCFLRGLVRTAAEAAVYAALLVLIMMFFTGNGQFIYEGF